jgi:hypothetical protein
MSILMEKRMATSFLSEGTMEIKESSPYPYRPHLLATCKHFHVYMSSAPSSLPSPSQELKIWRDTTSFPLFPQPCTPRAANPRPPPAAVAPQPSCSLYCTSDLACTCMQYCRVGLHIVFDIVCYVAMIPSGGCLYLCLALSPFSSILDCPFSI